MYLSNVNEIRFVWIWKTRNKISKTWNNIDITG